MTDQVRTTLTFEDLQAQSPSHLIHDATDLWLEAHIKHPIGLIHYEISYSLQIDSFHLQQIK